MNLEELTESERKAYNAGVIDGRIKGMDYALERFNSVLEELSPEERKKAAQSTIDLSPLDPKAYVS